MKQNNFQFLVPPTFFERAKQVKLTPRETEVAAELAAGETWKATASALGISIRTVEQHVEKIHMKVGFPSTVQCILFLLQSTGR